jgi:hypothetical protein
MIKRSYALEATTSLQTLYTVPEGARTEWTMLWVSNTAGTNERIDVTYYNAKADTTLIMFDDFLINSKDFFTVGGNYHEFLIMGEGDYIQVSSTKPCTFIASFIEYDNQFKNL